MIFLRSVIEHSFYKHDMFGNVNVPFGEKGTVSLKNTKIVKLCGLLRPYYYVVGLTVVLGISINMRRVLVLVRPANIFHVSTFWVKMLSLKCHFLVSIIE